MLQILRFVVLNTSSGQVLVSVQAYTAFRVFIFSKTERVYVRVCACEREREHKKL